jgi:hypothetical protein
MGTSPRSATALRRSRTGSDTARITPAAIRPHPTGGTRRNEMAEKATIPRTLPTRSSLYASRGSKRAKLRATPSPMTARAAATSTKMIGSTTSRGRPLSSGFPPMKTRLPVPCTSMSNGTNHTKSTRRARAAGVHPLRSRALRARRKPMPMPRKLPRSTKFEKWER